MNNAVFEAMCRNALEWIVGQWKLSPEHVYLVSGGSAWADHVAVTLVQRGRIAHKVHDGASLMLKGDARVDDDVRNWPAFKGVRIHLPCRLKDRGRFEATACGQTMNRLHEEMKQKLGRDTRVELFHEMFPENPMFRRWNGFHERNQHVAQSDYLLAYTWGRDGVKPGGTADTWNAAETSNKVHVPLHTLLTHMSLPPKPCQLSEVLDGTHQHAFELSDGVRDFKFNGHEHFTRVPLEYSRCLQLDQTWEAESTRAILPCLPTCFSSSSAVIGKLIASYARFYAPWTLVRDLGGPLLDNTLLYARNDVLSTSATGAPEYPRTCRIDTRSPMVRGLLSRVVHIHLTSTGVCFYSHGWSDRGTTGLRWVIAIRTHPFQNESTMRPRVTLKEMKYATWVTALRSHRVPPVQFARRQLTVTASEWSPAPFEF